MLIRNITGSLSIGGDAGNINGYSGILYSNTSERSWLWGRGSNDYGRFGGNWNIDASRAVPTAEDNRPHSIMLLPLISY